MKANRSLAAIAMTGLAWGATSVAFQIFFQLVLLAVLARLLVPNDFGVMSAALIVVGFSSIFVELGVGPALVQKNDLTIDDTRTGFTLSIFFGFLFGFFVWTLSPFVASFFNFDALEEVIKILAIFFPIRAYSVVYESLLQRDLKFKIIALSEIISYFFGYGLISIGFAMIGFGYWALVYGTLGQILIKTFILVLGTKNRVGFGFHNRSAHEIVYFGSGHSMAKIANYIAIQGDNIVVGRWLGMDALGIYGRAYQFLIMPANLIGRVGDKVIFPILSKMQNDIARLAINYRRGISIVALMAMPISALLVLLAPDIVTVLLGPKWDQVTTPFQILALGLIFRTSYKISDSLVRAVGAVYGRALRQVIYAIGVIIFSYIGHFWGISGVAVGVLLAVIMNYCLMAFMCIGLIKLNIKTFVFAHFPGVLLMIITTTPISVIAELLRLSGYSGFVVVPVSAIIFIFIISVIFGLKIKAILGEDGVWFSDILLSLFLVKSK